MNRKIERAGLIGISAAALLAALSPQAVAQTDQTDNGAEEDEIVVVGSRIRRDQFTSTSPVQVLTHDESVRAGLISTTEVLQSNAATSGGAQLNQLYGPFVVAGGNGVNTLGLRGYGPTSTLILLNGRRLTPAGTRGQVGAADLNSIPSSLVDRVEILKDGASSVYGSDAVAGVVNIVTNHGLDHFILDTQLNLPEQSGGEQTRISLSGGRTFGNLSLIGSIEYYEREPQLLGDRSWSACPGDYVRDPATGEILDSRDPLTGEPKCFTIDFPNSAGATVNTIATRSRAGFGGAGAPLTGNFTRWRPNSGVGDGTPGAPPNRLDGFEGVNGGGLAGVSNRDTFREDMLESELTSPTRNTNLFLSGVYELNDNHEVYGEVLYSRRESSTNQYIQFSWDYPNNELLPPELRLGGPQNPLSTIPNPPPVNVPLPAPYATQVRIFTALGNSPSAEEVDYTRLVAGIRGDLGLLPDWRYDINVYRGKNDAEARVENALIDRLFNSLVVTTTIPAATPPELIRNAFGVNVICSITATNPGYGCIPAPALTTQTVAGQYPADWLHWVRQTLVATTEYEETAYSIVLDGPLPLSLPGGPVQAVFGLEYRDASILDTPDINAQNGNVHNFTSGGITRGGDSVQEAFAELELPILRDAPFAESLTLNVSARYTDYESYGADSTYKVSGSWEPIPYLLFRAAQGTSYRAPALFEQFLAPVTGFAAGNTDPCSDYGTEVDPTSNLFANCDAEIGNLAFVQNSSVTVLAGGGAAAGLFAETSENSTLGVTWRPLRDVDSWGDFSLAADRFAIDLRDSITRLGNTNILNQCYNSPNPAAEPLCSLRRREPGTNLLFVNDFFFNVASQIAEGWDFGARYRHSVMGGEATVNFNMTQFTKQSFLALPGFTPDDTNGDFNSPEMTSDIALLYERGPWTLNYGVTWVAGMSNYNDQAEDPATSIFQLSTPDYYLHNASVQYTTDDWRLTLGVRNLMDEAPPRYSSNDQLINGIGGVPIFSGFDYVGRQFFVNLSANF